MMQEIEDIWLNHVTLELPWWLRGYGQRSLAGYSPRGRKESDTTEGLHAHTHYIKGIIPNYVCAVC